MKSVDFSGPGGRVTVPVNLDTGTNVTVKGVVWGLAGAYTVAGNEHTSLEVLLGFRYLGLETTTDWNLSGIITSPPPLTGQSFARTGSVKESEDLTGRDHRHPRTDRPGQREVGNPVLPRRGSGLLDDHLAGGGRHPVPVEPDRPEPDVPLPVLRHGERQAAAEPRFSGPALGVNFRF